MIMIMIMIIALHGTFQFDGNTLDNFAELKTVEGLKDGSLVKVVEEPYTMQYRGGRAGPEQPLRHLPEAEGVFCAICAVQCAAV
jgi:hypothetical protein